MPYTYKIPYNRVQSEIGNFISPVNKIMYMLVEKQASYLLDVGDISLLELDCEHRLEIRKK